MADARNADDPVRARFEPPMSTAGEPYWEATRDRRLVLPWCLGCGRAHWFPREACPHCLGGEIEWRDASGRGVVHAASVMPKPAMPMLADRVPYVVALVDLDEGVRLMTNIVEVAAEQVAVGMVVGADWEALSDGRHLLVFRPIT
jgi:uncharacterized OB-fold protein